MIAIPQIMLALVIGVCYYMLAVAMTVYDGLLSMIFQPIMGAIFSGIAISLLLIVGLPIRLSKKINNWWRKHWWISFVIGTVAFIMMCVSWLPYLRVKVMDPELDMMVDSFHPVLAIGGWLMTLFAVLHFYPPIPWLKLPTK
jgi:hypothetical protein